MPDLDVLGQDLITLMNWAQQGGSILFAMTPSKTSYFDVISLKLGVLSSSWNYNLQRASFLQRNLCLAVDSAMNSATRLNPL